VYLPRSLVGVISRLCSASGLRLGRLTSIVRAPTPPMKTNLGKFFGSGSQWSLGLKLGYWVYFLSVLVHWSFAWRPHDQTDWVYWWFTHSNEVVIPTYPISYFVSYLSFFQPASIQNWFVQHYWLGLLFNWVWFSICGYLQWFIFCPFIFRQIISRLKMPHAHPAP
jgi:hypothetical protein